MGFSGIRYVACNDLTGYGVAAARSMLGLMAAGIPLDWVPLSPGASRTPGLWYGPCREPSPNDHRLNSCAMRELDHDVVIVHTVPEYFPEWRRREPDRFLVGLTTWETERLPRSWPALLNTVDLLLVPCRWNKEVMQRDGVTVPIEVLPHISEPIATGAADLALAAGAETRVLYCINTWNHRKAMPQTVTAYLQAFTAEDDTLLLLKTGPYDLTRRRWLGYRPRVAATLRRLQRGYRRPARIQLVTDAWSSGQIHALHRRGQAFLSLTHGEGWGLGAFDAARAGNQVIITGYGGPMDYLPRDLAGLIDYRLGPIMGASANGSYETGQLWAEADLEQAVEVLRGLSWQPNPALADHVAQHFAADVVTQRLLTILSAHV